MKELIEKVDVSSIKITKHGELQALGDLKSFFEPSAARCSTTTTSSCCTS
jgi:hypothetical protein